MRAGEEVRLDDLFSDFVLFFYFGFVRAGS